MVASISVAKRGGVGYRCRNDMLANGTTFAGYTVLERLLHGGMADIYLVCDSNGHQFVLRVLLSHLRFSWRSSRRFRWGCEVLNRLNHPNVIRLFQYGKHDGQRFALLEYATGGNLRDRILRNDPVLATERRRLLLGMAMGLAHVHEKGFLHMDFKPENVLLSGNMEPKITDFDLAIPRPSQPERAKVLSGTFAYLAPEQIFGEPVDERADIFSFGITAYEMLCGRKPVTGESRAEMVQKYTQFNTHLKPLHAYLPDIPPTIERVILRCLEKDVNRRYPSMALVVRDLQT